MTESYQDRQQRLQDRALELTSTHPHLVPRPLQGRPKPGWVAGNMRKVFEHHWPGVPCTTKTDRWSNGTSIELKYPGVPGAPLAADVLAALKLFQSQRYNSEDETFDFDTDFEREAFRKAFGGTGKSTLRRKNLRLKSLPGTCAKHSQKAQPKQPSQGFSLEPPLIL